MGNHIRLIASDGHELGAWLAEPAGTPRAGLVVLQEIFGVTGHIRAVTDSFAAAGKVGVIRYCWGGALADLAGCRGTPDDPGGPVIGAAQECEVKETGAK
jgi:hypothetical protein